MKATHIWDTPRGKPECVIVESQPTETGPHVMVIELTESIKGDQYMKKGQRKVTTSQWVKPIIAALLILSLSSCVVGKLKYSYGGRTWVTTLTAFE